MIGRVPFTILLSLAWAVAGLLLAFFTAPGMGALGPFMVIPLWMGYAIAGIGIVLVCLAALWRAGTAAGRGGPLGGLAILLGVGAALWFGGLLAIARVGDGLFFRARFARLSPAYERIAAEVGSATVPTDRGGIRHGITYEVDAGPPVRLAFPQPGGIIDNREGVVYDPSNAVAAARGWDYTRGEQRFTAPPEVRALFGGNIVWCEHIRRSWYRCWFT